MGPINPTNYLNPQTLKRELKKKPKEVIKEVVKEVEVEADEVDINLRAPKGIKALEKKLEKRLNKDGD